MCRFTCIDVHCACICISTRYVSSLPTPTAVAGVGLFVPPFVCVSVFPPDIAKTDAVRITKHDVLHDKSWKHIYFGVKRQCHESQKHCLREYLHSCECWLSFGCWITYGLLSLSGDQFRVPMSRHDPHGIDRISRVLWPGRWSITASKTTHTHTHTHRQREKERQRGTHGRYLHAKCGRKRGN